MKRWGMVLGIMLTLVVGCGKEVVYVDKDGKPVTPEDCTPKAIADAGPDVYIAKGEAAPIADRAQIGAAALPGTEYSWEPELGLDDSSKAQPIASPDVETVYTLTAKTKCGEAKSAVTVHVLKETKKDPGFVVIDGETYFTGYNETYQFLDHYRASYLHMGTGYYAGVRFAGDTINLTPAGFHVNRQPQGSCWAEGARSAGEATHNYVTRNHVHISTQRIIDCSGFGSAGSGGQISVDDFVTHGLVREVDYPYNGHDNRCKKDVQGFYKAKSTFILRDKSGNRPKLDDILQAHFAFGASEDCGNAGALGNGGEVKNPGGGGTNHCWGGFGIDKMSDGNYCRIAQNSWGNWGPGWKGNSGQGCYGFKSDGSISSGIMAENKFIDMGSPCPPPKADAGPDKTILQIPGLPQSVVIGAPGKIKETYAWSVVSGDLQAKISDIQSAMPVVTPLKTTRFKVTVKNECAEAHAEVTVHVWRDVHGKRVLVQ